MERFPFVVADDNKGQFHHMYSLVGKHLPSEFKSNLILRVVPTEEWLDIVEDAMGLFEIIAKERIQ